MFFARRDAPSQLRPEDLRSLQLSLNTPVVRVENLPVAPARAVLLLHSNTPGRLDVVLSVRSLKSGEVLHFEPDSEIPDAERGIDAAMAFGEAMGFLFDEDELAAGNAERAFGLWSDLMGEGPTQPQPDAQPESPPASEEPSFEFVVDDADDEELLLVEAAPPPVASSESSATVTPPPDTMLLTSLVEDALAAEREPGQAEPGTEPRTAPTLTKFRPAEEPATTRALDSAAEARSPEADELEPPGADLEPAPAEPDLAEPDQPAPADPTPESGAPESSGAAPEDDTPALQAADSTESNASAVPRRRRLRKAALGRLRLVKKRKPSSDEARRQWLARILSAF